MKSSEFLKLEQTHLADIIAEEAGNEHYRAHDAHFEATDQTPKVLPYAHVRIHVYNIILYVKCMCMYMYM